MIAVTLEYGLGPLYLYYNYVQASSCQIGGQAYVWHIQECGLRKLSYVNVNTIPGYRDIYIGEDSKHVGTVATSVISLYSGGISVLMRSSGGLWAALVVILFPKRVVKFKMTVYCYKLCSF